MVAPSISVLNENAPAGYGGLVPGHNHGPWRSSPPLFQGLECLSMVRIAEDSPIIAVRPLHPYSPFVG